MTDQSVLAVNQQMRKRRLTYAMGSGILSKLSAVVVQWFALPLSLHALGTERYAAFLALQALVAWSSLLALGLVPSLPRFLSTAVAAHDKTTQRDIFQTAFIYLVGISIVFGGAMLLFGAIVPPSKLVAASAAHRAELWSAFCSVVLVAALWLVGSLMPSVRSGYQELHYSNVWAFIASLCILAGLHLFVSTTSSISTFVLIINGPPVCVMLADFVLICIQRPFLLQGSPRLGATGRLLAPQAANALAGQLAYFAVSSLPTLIIAHVSGPIETAAFGSVMQLLIVAGSGMNLIFQPLVPAIAHAYAHHDRAWVNRAYFRAAGLVIAICTVGLLTDIFAGHYLLHIWLGAKIHIPPMLPVALGCYFFIWMLNVLHFNILAATGNLGSIGRAYIVEGALSIGIGTLLAHTFGATGMAVGLAVGAACVNLWYLTLQVRRRVIAHT